jgi:F-box domain
MPSVSELASRFDQLKTDPAQRPLRRSACGQAEPSGQHPMSFWADIPPDIMRLVVDLLPLHDVQSTLLVCREWHNGFANGLLELKPRQLRVALLAARCDALTVQQCLHSFPPPFPGL